MKRLITALTGIALAAGLTGCIPGHTPLVDPKCTVFTCSSETSPTPPPDATEVRTDAPQAPGPAVTCPFGFTLNEFGDCKLTEAPQAPGPVPNPAVP